MWMMEKQAGAIGLGRETVFSPFSIETFAEVFPDGDHKNG